MNELALFAGAGGGILGGKLLGWRTVCAVEWEAYPASVLCARQNDKILPPFPIWDDVQTFDGKPWKGIVDVISGGFPCQDISAAGKGGGLKPKEAECGERWQGLLARLDQDTLLWKIPQCSLLEDSEQSLETWPRLGTMRNGVCWEQTLLDCHIDENEYGCWLPTPTVSMKNGCSSKRYLNSEEYRGSMPMEWLRTSKDCEQYFDPDYAELVMDFPDKWTDLNPLEMHKFQEWLPKPLKSLKKD